MLENYTSLIDVHIYFKWLCCVTSCMIGDQISLLVMWETSNLHETWRLRELYVNKSNSSCKISGRNRFKKRSIFIVHLDDLRFHNYFLTNSMNRLCCKQFSDLEYWSWIRNRNCFRNMNKILRRWYIHI